MIDIEIIREHGFLKRLEAKGHALFNKKGKDIVCSAISALIQNIYIGLHNIEGIDVLHRIKDGFFSIEIMNLEKLNKEVEKINFLINTTIESIKIISLSYNIKVNIEEVLK